MRILFFGSSEFSLPFLDWLKRETGLTVLRVITLPGARKGRGLELSENIAAARAREYGFPVETPERLNDAELLGRWKALKPDLLLVASYGKCLPKSLLDMTPHPLNIHPSLLPKYRGPNPILAAILNGDRETGVTLMRMSEKMDSGDIIAQNRLELGSAVTGGELELDLAEAGIALMKQFLEDLKKGVVPLRPQDEKEATYTQKIKKEDTLIAWQEPADQIDRRARAYFPKPRAYFLFRSRKVFIEQGALISEKPGEGEARIELMDPVSGSVALRLPKGEYLLIRVVPEGRKPMTAYEFAIGYRLKKDDLFV